MADVVVSEGGGDSDGGAADSAHAAAVAEGATAVQAASAAESAGQAAEAAEVALAAAAANVEAGAAVEGATATAADTPTRAEVSAQMVHEALQAQTTAIHALTEQLAADRKDRDKAPPAGRPASPPDSEPVTRTHGYYRPIGG